MIQEYEVPIRLNVYEVAYEAVRLHNFQHNKITNISIESGKVFNFITIEYVNDECNFYMADIITVESNNKDC